MPRHDAAPLPALTEKDQQRFWAKVSLPNSNGCMTWTATKNESGYGVISVGGRGGRLCRAHRIAYALAYGEPDPALTLDHQCRNRACCNPIHLDAVQHAENVRRGIRGVQLADENRARWAAVSHCKRGHRFDDANTIREAGGRRRCRTCHYMRNDAYRHGKAAEDLA